ncbi:MAG: hypothetical protein ABIO72_01800 [Patescibacteria group bacterium]
MTLDAITQQIKEKHYAAIPIELKRSDFEVAVAAFMKFLEVPQEVKDPIYFQLYPGNRGSEVGYKKYLRDLGNTDNREYFHYNEHADERFKEQETSIPELHAFLEKTRMIYAEAKRTIRSVVEAFEPAYPGLTAKFFVEGERPNFYLRFLKYDRLKPGEFLAKGHYDRGTTTLALAESAPGLRMGLTDADVRDVVHAEGQALFMPGLRFQSITSPDFPPTWHDVVQKNEDTFSQDVARWAVVFFADIHGVNQITYEEAHTPKAT